MARRSTVPSARSPISAPRVSSTSARLEPSRTSTPAITSGSIIRSRRVRRTATTFASIVGGPDCKQPYSHSLLNISAMSFGSLSANAIRALNKGAKLGGFAHDTGEGGFSHYHREFGGDIVWEIGSGYFGCRNEDGSFSPSASTRLRATADQDDRDQAFAGRQARPWRRASGRRRYRAESRRPRRADGGRLRIAGASPSVRHAGGADALHRATARVGRGQAGRFQALHRTSLGVHGICKAMLETGIRADFIVIDGKEGGTGASPLEFADHIGTPLREGLIFAHNTLVGAGLRDTVRLGASGRIITGFDLARVLALGADWCNIARGFMFALGCVQAQTCHTDRCPSGVATQNQLRQRAIVVETRRSASPVPPQHARRTRRTGRRRRSRPSQ